MGSPLIHTGGKMMQAYGIAAKSGSNEEKTGNRYKRIIKKRARQVAKKQLRKFELVYRNAWELAKMLHLNQSTGFPDALKKEDLAFRSRVALAVYREFFE